MEGRALPEVPSQEGFADLTQRADEGPVTMLNLLSFNPDGGRERYAEYGEAVLPLLEKAGGRLVFQGEAAPVVLGGESWDLVLLVEFAHLRTEALAKGELHPLDG
jgi:hypothetical protein